MIRKVTLCICTVMVVTLAIQAQELTRSVIAVDGGEVRNSHLTLNWTLGQTATETVSADGMILTQGFQQPTLVIERQTPSTVSPGFDVDIYPNPATSEINEQPRAELETKYEVIITDVTGQVLTTIRSDSSLGNTTVNVAQYPGGTYFITVISEADRAPATYKLIKV